MRVGIGAGEGPTGVRDLEKHLLLLFCWNAKKRGKGVQWSKTKLSENAKKMFVVQT